MQGPFFIAFMLVQEGEFHAGLAIYIGDGSVFLKAHIAGFFHEVFVRGFGFFGCAKLFVCDAEHHTDFQGLLGNGECVGA